MFRKSGFLTPVSIITDGRVSSRCAGVKRSNCRQPRAATTPQLYLRRGTQIRFCSYLSMRVAPAEMVREHDGRNSAAGKPFSSSTSTPLDKIGASSQAKQWFRAKRWMRGWYELCYAVANRAGPQWPLGEGHRRHRGHVLQ